MTPTTLSMYDASVPPLRPPGTDVVGIYAGGDTPHIWTPNEIAEQKARYRLPIWVRSNPSPSMALSDADRLGIWLRSHDAPNHIAVLLDLETAITRTYVELFATLMMQNSFFVLVYGSSSTLFKNPVCGGYFLANPGPPVIPSGCVAVQYADNVPPGVDLSVIYDSVPLWDTNPQPSPSTGGSAMAVSPTVSFRPTQDDVFQCSQGTLWHKWRIGPTWDNENLPAVVGLSGVTFTGDAPQVAVLAGCCYVTVEATTGTAYCFTQGPTGNWAVTKLP